ncbi:putative ribosomal protein YlxQ [bioreactor metagenome]|uniref:Putative ribosomal protein YlxQ n=1 Tax=bioreactor metagenome TaxID=1076179 RepID=A0A645BTD4_9ZZZZ|nr:ribosomal L7Ae/L30e/S12e/Gadd45 family protein [Erysipelotrichaceae bacterium]
MSKVHDLIGIARRANKLVYGDALHRSIRKQQPALVVIASDASLRTTKHLLSQCDYYMVPYIIVENTGLISQAIGKANVKAVGINEQGIAKEILKNK